MKLITFKHGNEYAEESQSIRFMYSFLKRKNKTLDTFTKEVKNGSISFNPVNNYVFEELFSPVKCKDFLDDIIMANIKETILEAPIYGFDYPEHFVTKPYLWMSIHSTPSLLDTLRKNLHFIHELEGTKKTQVFDVDDSDTTIIIRVPPMWTELSPTIFSVYTFLLRAIAQIDTEVSSIEEICYILSKKGATDARIASKLMVSGISLKFLIDNREVIFEESCITGVPSEDLDDKFFRIGVSSSMLFINISNVHNMTGLLSLCNLYKKFPNNEKISEFNSLFISKYKKLLSKVVSINEIATKSLIDSKQELGGYLLLMKDN